MIKYAFPTAISSTLRHGRSCTSCACTSLGREKDVYVNLYMSNVNWQSGILERFSNKFYLQKKVAKQDK